MIPTIPPSLTSRPFGVLPTGEEVVAYVLRGAGGFELEALSYGGIVTRLLAPDREGRLADVVLGLPGLAAYAAGHPYFGAIAGRVAGRLTGARFFLDGEERRLAANDPPHHLHGGARGFDKRVWRAAPVARADGAPSVRFAYRSPDGEEGYPGAVDVSVTYTVAAGNAFTIESEAASDRATPFNLTHHSYFNLAGEGSGPVAGHELRIDADEVVPCDARMGLSGVRAPVAGTAADFRRARRLGEALPGLFLNHGDLYVLRPHPGRGAAPARAAVLSDPASGRRLEVRTTEAFLQLYTGAALDGSLVGKSGAAYGRHAGVCLECEDYPDGANAPALGNGVLRPGEIRRHATVYAFSTC